MIGRDTAAVGKGDALVDDLQGSLVIAVERQHRGKSLATVDHHVSRRILHAACQRQHLQPLLLCLFVVAVAVVRDSQLVMDVELLRGIVGCESATQRGRTLRDCQRCLAALQRAQGAGVGIQVAGQQQCLFAAGRRYPAQTLFEQGGGGLRFAQRRVQSPK